MSNTSLTIGRLAKAADVNVETIRYYQRIGLVVEPIKPLGGFRIYPDETSNRIRFIKRAQKLGFSLHDIAQMLELGNDHCDEVREQAEVKLAKIEAQIKDLQSMRKTLKSLITECHDSDRNKSCPIVESLIKESSSSN